MTLKETRRFIYQQMQKLESGDISIDEALTQSKLATRIIESYNTEARAIELAHTLGTPIASYPDGLLQIGEEDVQTVQ